MAPKRSIKFDPAVVRAWVERTRLAQGLPPTIEDPIVIARLVGLIRLAEEDVLRRRARLETVNQDSEWHRAD